MNKTPHIGLIAALTAAVVSGIAVFTNGIAVRRFDDATVYTTAKNLIAGVVLIVAFAIARRSGRDSTTSDVRGAWPQLTVIALIGGAIPFVLFFEGLSRANSTNAAFIHKTLVIWVAIGATVLLRERVTLVHTGAIALLVSGHLVLTNGLGGATFGTAELLVLLATLSWAAEVIVVKRLLPTVQPRIAAVSRMAGGSLFLLGWLAIKGDLEALTTMTATQWAWLMLTGVTLAGFVTAWYSALALAPAVDVSAILVLGAVITGALNVGFRGVPLTINSYGYLLIAAGAAVVVMHSIIRRNDRTAPG